VGAAAASVAGGGCSPVGGSFPVRSFRLTGAAPVLAPLPLLLLLLLPLPPVGVTHAPRLTRDCKNRTRAGDFIWNASFDKEVYVSQTVYQKYIYHNLWGAFPGQRQTPNSTSTSVIFCFCIYLASVEVMVSRHTLK
jgi:hypothetical protein